jgi:UDP-glucose 4-epimerase
LIELIDEIKRLTGHGIEYEVRPMRAGDQLVYVTDYGKIHRDTAWQPTMTVRQTLESIYDWWRCNPELFTPVSEMARLSPLSGGLPVSA